MSILLIHYNKDHPEQNFSSFTNVNHGRSDVVFEKKTLSPDGQISNLLAANFGYTDLELNNSFRVVVAHVNSRSELTRWMKKSVTGREGLILTSNGGAAGLGIYRSTENRDAGIVPLTLLSAEQVYAQLTSQDVTPIRRFLLQLANIGTCTKREFCSEFYKEFKNESPDGELEDQKCARELFDELFYISLEDSSHDVTRKAMILEQLESLQYRVLPLNDD